MARRRSDRDRPARIRGDAPRFPGATPLSEDIPLGSGTARLVPETDGSILVEIDGVPSSLQHPDPTHLVFEYMRWMRTAILARGDAADAPLEIAHLGGGGCSLPRALAADLPRASQTVVELDPVLAERVRGWFDLPRAPRLRIRQEDAARALVEWRDDRFDLLTRDVFAGAVTPRSLRSTVAASHAARVLRDGGMYLVNSAGGQTPRADVADEVATLRTAFAHVGVIAEPGVLTGRRRGNTVLLASQAPLPGTIDRALRSDPVSVRFLVEDDVRALERNGRPVPPSTP